MDLAEIDLVDGDDGAVVLLLVLGSLVPVRVRAGRPRFKDTFGVDKPVIFMGGMGVDGVCFHLSMNGV